MSCLCGICGGPDGGWVVAGCLERLAGHPDSCDVGRGGRARTPWPARPRRPAAWRRPTSRVVPAAGPQPERVELLAHAKVADLVDEPERLGAGARREVQQVRRGQRQPPVAEQLLHEVRLQPLLEQREPGAGADVGAERDPHPGVDVARAAGTARCRARSCSSGSARRVAPPGGEERRAPASTGARCARRRCAGRRRPCSVVGVEVVVDPRTAVDHLGDLGEVLVDVRGEPAPRDVVERAPRTTSSRLAGRRRARTAGVTAYRVRPSRASAARAPAPRRRHGPAW